MSAIKRQIGLFLRSEFEFISTFGWALSLQGRRRRLGYDFPLLPPKDVRVEIFKPNRTISVLLTHGDDLLLSSSDIALVILQHYCSRSKASPLFYSGLIEESLETRTQEELGLLGIEQACLSDYEEVNALRKSAERVGWRASEASLLLLPSEILPDCRLILSLSISRLNLSIQNRGEKP